MGTVTAETTNYSDSSLAPETTYYYKIQAINLNGASTLIPAFVGYQARWQFNNDYSDASGNNKVISGSNGPTFSTDMQEGAHSINLDGSNDFINVNSSSGDFLRGGYTAKTVAFWMKADQTNSNRGIFDFGGSDDGLAMRLNSNQLYAGIASNNTRKSLSVTYTSTSWNHIALVYNVNEIRLYVNGVSVAENTNLGFNSVTVTSNGSRIGDDNTSNALTTSFGVFDGKFDDFMIIGSALTATEINQIISHSYGAVTATTLSLPLLPSEPTNLAAIVESSSKINLTWTDNATTISYYEVWRSAFNNSNFELVKTLSGANSSYSDNSLTDNTMYYYKVRAVNEAGNSNYSNETSAATLINPTTIVSLSAIPSFEIVNDTTFVLNMTATSDLGTTITYSSNNLPSFAQIITNPDNTGLLKFSANSHDLGKYNLSVTATDNFGGSDTKSFVLNVLGKNQTVINLNFNQSLPQSLPWNNTNSAPVANLTLNSLKDNNNNNTSVGFKLLNSMVGSYSNAVTTGNNSGVYPDNVLKTMYFSSSNTPIQFNLTGLSSSKKYSLIIHAGYPWTPQQQATTGTLIGVYSAGAESATLDAANNTSNIVRLNALSPNASGIITVNMQKAPGAGYLIINAMQIVSYDDSQASITFNAPFSVKATGTSSDMIKLNWQNPSESRTGIEIWRSTSPNGSYILRSTVGPNDLTYSDNGLTSGATYFYKLRSVNNLIFSNYSEPVGASTVSYVIKLNLNSQETLSQASPWNNLNTLTYSGFTFENMVNTNSQPTGVNFGVIDNFTSFHDGVGISTGNNSGVVPDNVMKTLYYVAGGDVANFTLSGLNRTHIYNIEFYAGSVFNYPSLSDYQIGDEIVQLNGLNNTTQTVRINNVKPDSTGTIHVRFSTTSMYAFLNALIIHGMPSPEIVALDSVNASGNSNQNGRMIYVSEIVESENAGVTAATTVVPDKLQQKNALEVAPEFSGDVQAYPNPFEDRINLRFNFKQDVPKFTIILTDMSGRQVLRNEFGKVYSGVWQQTLELNKKLPVGIYMLHIIGLPDEKPKVLKLLKSTSF